MTQGKAVVPPLKIATAPHLFHGIRHAGAGKGGKDKVDATVVTRNISWPKFVSALSKLQIAPKKEKCRYFVFADFTEEAENGEMLRRNSSVGQFYGAVLDIDTPDAPDFETVQATLQEKGLAFALYSTHSYDPLTPGKENKFRVVVPYADPVSGREQPFVVLGFAEMLGLSETFDRCSQTASQPMYWHSAPADRAEEAIFAYSLDGAPLDPDEAHALGKMLAGENKGRAYKVPPSEMRPGMQMDAGERHNQFVGFLKWSKQNGDSLEQAMLRIQAINDNLDDPLDEEQIEGLRRVWASFERNNNAFGFEHHRTNIASLPMQQKEVYESVMQQMANSKDTLDPAELKELFTLIKSQRPGATLKSVEAHYKELTVEVELRTQEELSNIRERVDAFLQKGLKRYVWLTEADKVVNVRDGTTIPIRGFKNKIGRAYNKCVERFGAVFHELKLGREYVLDHALIREAARLGYHPCEDELYEFKGVTYLNTYREPEGESVKGDVGPLLAHLTYLIPNPREREWFISMIAFAKQKPGHLIKYMYVIEGGKGIGKSILRQKVLEPVFGPANVQEVTSEMLADDKKAWVSTAHVDVFEEFAFPADRIGRSQVHNFLKKYLANANIPRRAMQKDYIEVPNFSLKLAFKNPEDKVKIEPGDRRWVVVRAPMQQKGQDYYNKFVAWLDKPETQAAIREFFGSWDYEAVGFTPDFPLKTSYTTEMEGQTEDWPGALIELALDHPMTPFDIETPLMLESDLITLVSGLSSHYGYEAAQAEGLRVGKKVPRLLLRNTLEAMGFECLTPDRFKREEGNKGHRIWDKVWAMPGVDAEAKKVFNPRSFSWVCHRDDLQGFSTETRAFVRVFKESLHEHESQNSEEWPVDGELD